MGKMATVEHHNIKLREVNRHLVCRLCRGYYVDATTIAECLHSFCRSCIIKYLEKNSFCPICEVQIHKTKPYLNLRLDKALQDVVYKLVPGLYHDEMKRRREFYSKHQDQIPTATPEQCGLEERIIFSPLDSISLSLEYLESDDFETETGSSQSSESGDNPEGLSFPQQLGLMKLKNNDGKNSRRESQDVQESSRPKRYLQCPAVVNVSHLKKFIRMKHDLTDKMQVDIIHKRVPLPDHYTLMDVAYIYTWKRSAPMRLFYQIYRTKKHKVGMLAPLSEAAESNLEQTVTTKAKDMLDKNENGDVGRNEANCKIKSNDIRKSNMEKTVNGEAEKTVKNEEMKIVENGKLEEKEVIEKLKTNSSDKREESKEVLSEKVSTNKNDKSEFGAVKSDNANKVTSDNTKNWLESNGKIKETESKVNEKLLLNPISGQLETVPLVKIVDKSPVNGPMQKDEKKENVENVKNSTPDPGTKKPETDCQKDVKKSSVNLLKSFRKEKSSSKETKTDMKNGKGNSNSLTITTVSKREKPLEKETANVSIEIKPDKNSSEYDFDGGSSPPSKIVPLQEYTKSEQYKDKYAKNSWISLQDFRKQMLKENHSEDPFRKDKNKCVPPLYRISEDGSKKSGRKTPNRKLSDMTEPKKASPTIINIKTENQDSKKTEIKIEVSTGETCSPPRPIKIENKGGEYSIKQNDDDKKHGHNGHDKLKTDTKKHDEVKTKSDAAKSKELLIDLLKRSNSVKPETNNPKKSKPNVEEGKNDHFGAIDLSKNETSPKSEKNPLENLMDMAGKTGTSKTDENMVEVLISVAQKQSIEPLLKIPQYSQNTKNSASQGSPPGKNISSNDISQALQFFKDLRSDIKFLEAKSQLSPNSLMEQFSQKSPNLAPFQLYQQQIDLIRRLKRQQIAANESQSPQRKQPKLSPNSESKRKFSPESKTKMDSSEAAQLKSSVERTLSQIQEQMEIQSRMVAAQNYKNLPALLQFYNRPPSLYCPGSTSPTKSIQNKYKASSHSPNSQKSPNSRKSPQNLTSSSSSLPLAMANSEASFFNSQNYSHLFNAGLNSEMTFHQMFQNYLNQQDKMNQIKHSQALAKKPTPVPPGKSISDLYYGSPPGAKKPEPTSVPNGQKI